MHGYLSRFLSTTGPGQKLATCRCFFGILDRSSDSEDDVTWIEAENCFNFHVLNAYDDPADPNRVIMHTFRQALRRKGIGVFHA